MEWYWWLLISIALAISALTLWGGKTRRNKTISRKKNKPGRKV